MSLLRIGILTRHSLHAALRSRFFLAMLALLGMVVWMLPRTLQGDGTVEGEARMLLTWTLGSALVLLSIATLWTGCGLLSSERAEGLSAQVMITPSHPAELWLGKWLGLSLLSNLLLVIVSLLVGAQAVWRGLPLSTLNPLQRIAPSEAGLAEHAATLLARAQAADRIPPDQDSEEILRRIMAQLRTEYLPVAPGEAHQWTFEPNLATFRPGEPVRIRVEFLSPMGSAMPIEGLCRVLDSAGQEIATATVTAEDRRHVEFNMPVEQAAGSPTLTVLFENRGEEHQGAVLIHAAEGAFLLVPVGSFFGNLVAACLVMGSVLTALAGIGIAAGALFSMPVAVFVASAIAIFGLLSHAQIDGDGCGHDHHADTSCEVLSAGGGLTQVSETALRHLARLTQPVVDAAPLDTLGDRLRLERRHVVWSLLRVGFFLPLLAGLCGTLALRHQEFP